MLVILYELVKGFVLRGNYNINIMGCNLANLLL